MIVLLASGASAAQGAQVLAALQRLGLRGRLLEAGGRRMIHVLDRPPRRIGRLLRADGVEALIATSRPRIRAHGRRFFPYHFLGWATAWLAASGGLVLLAGFFPPGLAPPAAPLAEVPPAELPWYLAGAGLVAGWLAPLASWLPWLAAAGVVVLALALPALDRGGAAASSKGRWLALSCGLGLLLGYTLLSLWAIF